MNQLPAYPGLYLAVDPRPHAARAAVESMLSEAGSVGNAALAIQGPGFAVAGVSPPGRHPQLGPGLHADERGLLIWAGEMCMPSVLTGSTQAVVAPDHIASALFDRLVPGGPEILGEIDGSFCGAWFDARRGAWSFFNDRWGLIPLFWWADGDRLLASPKARLTWRAARVGLSVDGRGVADLLRTQNMLEDHTLIAGVHWLEPAHCITWDAARTRRQHYWDFQHAPRNDKSSDEILARFVEASRSTLGLMTETDGPILQGISGGLDSRLFLAVCHEAGRTPACYTSGFAYSEDMRFGRKLARAAGAVHEALVLDARTLPDQLSQSIIDTDGLHGAAHLVMSAPIAAHLNQYRDGVLIEGYLHGVLGGSDLPADADVPAGRPAHTHPWALDFLHSGGDRADIDELLFPGLAAESRSRWASHVDSTFARARIDDPLCRAEYAIITGRSGRNDVLVPAMFRRYLTVRHPACDRRMLAWYATTPAIMRRARQAYIEVLRRYYPRFARVPRADGCSGMPLAGGRWLRECHWRLERSYSLWAQLRYANVRKWGRDSRGARAWAFDVLRHAGVFEPMLAADARIREWIRPGALQSQWETACRDPRRSIPLLTLLTVELMVRRLQQQAAPCPSEDLKFRTVSFHAHRTRACMEVA